MEELLQNSLFAGVMLSILTYELGVKLRKRFHYAFVNPLLIAIVVIIFILTVFHIDYEVYYAGARYLSYFLTPATVCLAVPLYTKIKLLKKNAWAIFAGILSGALANAVCILVLSALFGLSHGEYVTLLPKSITTAIGMGISAELGGIATITVAVIIITGVLGNIIADSICKIFKIDEAVAKGIAIGSSAHAVGTAKAMEMGETEGAMSSLAIVVSGLITVFLAPVFARLL